jgi:hypothetical protein
MIATQKPIPRDLAAEFGHAWSAAALAPDNWGRDDWRAPSVPEGETVLFAEPGRVLRNTCFRSHYFAVTRGEYGRATLRVHHGGGEEAFHLSYDGSTERTLALLDSDARYLLLWQFMELYGNGCRDEGNRWLCAAAEKRIRVRKVRGQNLAHVSIEPRRTNMEAAA